MPKFKVEWMFEGTFEIEAEDEHEAKDKAENFSWTEISETVEGCNLKVITPPCQHKWKHDGENWYICTICGLAARIKPKKEDAVE